MSMVHVHVFTSCPCPCPCRWCMSNHVHAACPCLCCMPIFMLHVYVHGACPCPCCMSMSMEHVLVHTASPCPCCMAMSMYILQCHVHVQTACPYPCPCNLSVCACMCLVLMLVLVSMYKCWTVRHPISLVRNEKTINARTGPSWCSPAFFFGSVLDWNYGCQNADKGFSFLNAELCFQPRRIPPPPNRKAFGLINYWLHKILAPNAPTELIVASLCSFASKKNNQIVGNT
jgi:hypothetical protein